MGKRSNADFYQTPLAPVVPLIPYLRGIRTFAELCAGDGDEPWRAGPVSSRDP
jgi:hypothetical protein